MGAVLAKGLPFRFRAHGKSMTPIIRDGDIITVFPFLSDPPEVGDVVAFVKPETGNLVVHRVVAKGNDHFLIWGDNITRKSDGRVPEDQLIGRVIRVERNGRQVKLGLGPERAAIAWISKTRVLLSIFKGFILKIINTVKITNNS